MVEKPGTSTMIEVAEAAGVSIATVSRVINGKGGVSKKLEERVLRAMKKLHYHPSLVARSLVSQRSMLVGIVIPILEHPAYSRMASAIERKLFEHNYRAIICNSEDDQMRETSYLEMLMRQRVDGIILNTSVRDTALLEELHSNKIPMVLFDRMLTEISCNQVFCDNSLGGYTGIKHLVELGHRRIAVVGAPLDTEPIQRRIRGTKEAIAEFGLEDDPTLLVTGDSERKLFAVGYEAAMRLLALDEKPTAIFALTEVAAVGVMHAAAEMGLSIPNDLSVLSYDDLPLAEYFIPPLTSIAQPFIEMGETAVNLLLDQIEDPSLPPQKVVLPTRLVVRQTTAPPPMI